MKNKGITMISLVVTIVLLLIISGVTIGLVTENNGIFIKALESRKTAEIGAEKEKLQMAVIQTMQDSEELKIEKEKLEQNLIMNIGQNEIKLKDDEDGYLVKIIKTNRYYNINKNGEITFAGDASEIEKNMENMVLGDNLMDSAELVRNTYISADNGKEVACDGWDSSDYINIGNYKNILIASDNSAFLDRYNALYDENKETIRTMYIQKSKLTNDVLGDINISLAIINLNENEKYIRISQKSSIMRHIKIYPILNDDSNNTIKFKINKSLLDEFDYGENLLTGSNVVNNTYISATNGSEIAYNSWDSTDFVNVKSYRKLAIVYEKTNPVNSYSGMYDSEKNYISKVYVERNMLDAKKGKISILNIPENVTYIRLSSNRENLNNIEIRPIIERQSESDFINQNIKIDASILTDEKIIPDYYIDANGGEVSYKGWSETDYLDLSIYNKVLIIGNSDAYNAIYDENKKFIQSANFTGNSIFNSKKSNQDMTYNITFTDEMKKFVNMKYKLKMDNIYIKGNEEEYVTINNLNVSNISVLKDSANIFTLEWYWEDNDELDTQIGISDERYYTINLNIEASQN